MILRVPCRRQFEIRVEEIHDALSKVRVGAVCAALSIGILMLSGCIFAQEASSTPTAGADIFDPAVAEATRSGSRHRRSSQCRIRSGSVRLPGQFLQSADRTTPPGRSAGLTGRLRCGVRTPFTRWSTGRSGSRTNQIYQKAIGGSWRSWPRAYVFRPISPTGPPRIRSLGSLWGVQLRLDDVNDPLLRASIPLVTPATVRSPEPKTPCYSGVETTVSE